MLNNSADRDAIRKIQTVENSTRQMTGFFRDKLPRREEKRSTFFWILI